MKISRPQRGSRISLNDGEFEALTLLVEHGQAAHEEQGEEFQEHASAAAKRAFREHFSRKEPMEIDEDRRR
ncbi:MAG: hypothetical protein ACLQJR_20210 [Stellaceae bacterium]